MLNWYQRSMPTINDVKPHIEEIARTIKQIRGVKSVYAHGSFVSQDSHPNYPLKDIDLIAVTDFDSGDLMAIDAGKDSPLKLTIAACEELGFNPEAVAFTKAYLATRKYNIDHWASSRDGKLLHWGPMQDNIDEWKEAHASAEEYATEITGYNRLRLFKGADSVKSQWHQAYSEHINKDVKKKEKLMGWLPSEHSLEEIRDKTRIIL